ncbi:MAG: hypothetical protein NUV82_04265 [Candidatus Komeilibacteria bacterium]|nr:hypothetical protein [Candidatus Komeilibacteria bacterium]
MEGSLWFYVDLIVGVLLSVWILYAGESAVETPGHVTRLVAEKESPSHIQKAGWGFVWRLTQSFYDYTKDLLEIEYLSQKLYTQKYSPPEKNKDQGTISKSQPPNVEADEVVDDMVLLIDGVLYGQLPEDERSLRTFWEKGFRPPKNEEQAGEFYAQDKLHDLLDSFMLGVLREEAANLTWKHIVYSKASYEEEVNKVIRGEKRFTAAINNPFISLGIRDCFWFQIRLPQLPQSLEDALYAMAVAKNKGEAEEAAAEFTAKAKREIYNAMNENREAALTEAIRESKGTIILDLSMLTKIFGEKEFGGRK